MDASVRLPLVSPPGAQCGCSDEREVKSDKSVGSGSRSDKHALPVLPVAALLDVQKTLTAVDRFSERHHTGELAERNKIYRDLIPLERPKPGQQYAFQVDLDACTGCKACVAACHSLNGLDESELWRTTGVLHGGLPDVPAQQTVTSSCHHCLSPACMHGCPTRAYEKDPVTGIVRHLDDQCFGCRYCTLMCPYDAPKYNHRLGIVRKCDMCSHRLEDHEAPACVDACPNRAISIEIVDHETMIRNGDANAFLPGAPTPEHTLPSTVYRSDKRLPANLLPADFYSTRPEHSHPPLVVMLTLTQLAVGAFVLGLSLERITGAPIGAPLAQACFACLWALLALGASVFHLGRPWLFYRALLGLRTSWLSREALAFGLFAQLALLYAALVALSLGPHFVGQSLLARSAPTVQELAAAAGLVGVLCSVMVYTATRRAQWSGTQVSVKFLGTTLALGAAALLVVSLWNGPQEYDRGTLALLWLELLASGFKLAFEANHLAHARNLQLTIHKRVAIVMLDELRSATMLRFLLGAAGGLMIPILLLNHGVSIGTRGIFATLMFSMLLASESLERYLFFRAAPASRMPGNLR